MKLSIFNFDNKGIQDDGCVNSEEMKTFSRSFKNFLKKIFEDDNVQIVSYKLNHYDVSGFLKRNNQCVYFSYDVPRGEQPIHMKDNKILIRLAKNEKDFTGHFNHFVNFEDFHDYALRLLNRYDSTYIA